MYIDSIIDAKGQSTRTSGNRLVLLHAHIFKNAGSTIDWILERNFGVAFRDDRADSLMLKDSDYLQNLVGSDNNLKAISSHSLPLPAPKVSGVDFIALLMLRDPLLRVRSVYDFERRQKAETPGAKHAKIYSFKEYVEWRMSPSVSPTIRNMQVRYLTRTVPLIDQNLTENHMNAATDLIDSNPFVGVVERFDQSMAVFRRGLLNHGLDLDFAYKKQNITSKSVRSRDQLVEALKCDLGDSLFDHVVEQNRYDSNLYDHATKVVASRFASLSDNDKAIVNSLRM